MINKCSEKAYLIYCLILFLIILIFAWANFFFFSISKVGLIDKIIVLAAGILIITVWTWQNYEMAKACLKKMKYCWNYLLIQC